MITTNTPGKLIISGEYSALYGMNAIICTVPYSLNVSIQELSGNEIFIELNDYNQFYKINKLNDCRKINQLNPSSLVNHIICIANSIKKIKACRISINSKIPIGSGMGSSAALIVGLLKSLFIFSGVNLTYNKFFNIALNIENLVHHKSSGIDILAIMNGGCFVYKQNKNQYDISNSLYKFLINSDKKLFFIFTGKPDSSTSESVAYTSDILTHSNIKYSFQDVTSEIENSIVNSNINGLVSGIRQNHHLLDKIGVVPKKIIRFVEEIDNSGGAAKISGAGSISGDNAGFVIALCKEIGLKKIISKYNYNYEKMKIGEGI